MMRRSILGLPPVPHRSTSLSPCSSSKPVLGSTTPGSNSTRRNWPRCALGRRHGLPAGARARLVIDLRSAAVGTGAVSWPPVAAVQLLHAGQWSERHEIPCGPTDQEATAAVETAVRWAATEIGKFSVGLVVSRHLYDRVPEAWLLREEDDDPQWPLGFLHPVVLHSAERPRVRAPYARPGLIGWQPIRARPATPTSTGWPWPRRTTRTRILVTVEASRATCIGLEFPPGPAAQPLGSRRPDSGRQGWRAIHNLVRDRAHGLVTGTS